jgi:RNA polymerase sigma-70 factor (ECF subfamily)
LLTLDELGAHRDQAQVDPEVVAGERQAVARLTSLVQALAPPDRQIVLLYLDGLEASAIGEICGLKAGAVATKIHRLKALLAERFRQGGLDAR